MKQETKIAIELGIICSFSYFMVYFTRNILSVVTPNMIESGYGIRFIGILSTVFFVAYAIGQLINGIIGDILSPKYMICIGLVLGAVLSSSFILFDLQIVKIVIFAFLGFAMSMIYAPMTKIISENTGPENATRLLLALATAALIASPIVGITATVFKWRSLFVLSSVLLGISGVICFVRLSVFEKKKLICYTFTKKSAESGTGRFNILIKNDIMYYSFVSIITGIIRTSVIFWVPTFLAQYCGCSSKVSAVSYSAITTTTAFSPYVGVWLYKYILKRNISNATIIGFAIGTVSFLITCLVKNTAIDVFFVAFALLGGNIASAMLWNVYCPSLGKTGMVSTAAGYLDFVSYAGGAIANLIFSNAVEAIGWNNLLVVWALINLLGVLAEFIHKKNNRAV